MLVNAKEMFAAARKGNFAVPSANFFDQVSVQSHVETAEDCGLPIIIGYAESHKCYLSLEEAAALGRFYAESVKTPVALHLDHGMSLDTVQQAIKLGFNSVMIDASQEVLAKNIAVTKEVVDYAHAHGVPVEAEIGHVGTGISDTDHSEYTSVEEAQELVAKTGLDSLAISIGTAHGTYRGTPVINFERLAELSAALSVPLVLHGGSSSGDENLSKCALGGISKINIFTDFVLAAEKALKVQPFEGYFKNKDLARQAMSDCLKHYYGVFQTKKI